MRLVLAAAAVTLFIGAVAHYGGSSAVAIIASRLPIIPIVAAPALVVLALDSLVTDRLLRSIQRTVGVIRIAGARLSGEAIGALAPGSGLVADAVACHLLARSSEASAAEASAAAVARRVLIMKAQAIFIVLATLVGWGTIASCSNRLFGSGWLPCVVMLSALLPLSASLGVGGLLSRTRPATALFRFARKLFRRARAEAPRDHDGAATFDHKARELISSAPVTNAGVIAWVAIWSLECVETLVILRVLGAHVGIPEAAAIHASTSLVRSLAFFAPLGLGVEDIAAITLASSIDLAAGGPAAFVMIRRAREVLFFALGGFLLLASGRGPQQSQSGSRIWEAQ